MSIPTNFGPDVQNGVNLVYDEHINNLRAWLTASSLHALASNTDTMTGNVSLLDTDAPIQFLDPGGSARAITLPAEANTNHIFVIANMADADEEITVQDDTPTTIDTVAQGEAKQFQSDGTSWVALSGGGAANQITETSGPTTLNVASIPDGTYFKRSGTDIVGDTPSVLPATFNARLTLETGVPVSSSEQADKTIVYLTKCNGNNASLYTGSAWISHELSSDLSLTISSYTASTMYDIFLDYNSGTPQLNSAVCTDTTTSRSDLTTQDGVYVKSGDATQRYIGSIYVDSGQKVQDTYYKRFVWNLYNQVKRGVLTYNSNTSWTYNTQTYRESNGGTGQVRGQFVLGILAYNHVNFASALDLVTDNASPSFCAVGVDTTTTYTTCFMSKNSTAVDKVINNIEYFLGSVGYHYITTVEWGRTGATTTYYGSTTVSTPSSMRTGSAMACLMM